MTTPASGPAVRSLEERTAELEARVAIGELVAGYCQGQDRDDLGLFLSLWHDDATWATPWDTFVGLDEIRGFRTDGPAPWTQGYHWTTNHTVRFESATRATGRSDALVIVTEADNRARFVGATYEDVYERRDGVWRFARRTLHRWFVSTPSDATLRATP
jgi:gamma-hexachlorocyclohexane dehydrochlorinase